MADSDASHPLSYKEYLDGLTAFGALTARQLRGQIEAKTLLAKDWEVTGPNWDPANFAWITYYHLRQKGETEVEVRHAHGWSSKEPVKNSSEYRIRVMLGDECVGILAESGPETTTGKLVAVVEALIAPTLLQKIARVARDLGLDVSKGLSG